MHIKLKYGNTNTFFIRGMSGNLLVDTDYAGTLPAFYRAIKDYKIKTSDITYILATHYHPDHIGLISELMNQGVKLLVIDIQYSHIHFADNIFARDKKLAYEPIHVDNAIIISTEESRAFGPSPQENFEQDYDLEVNWSQQVFDQVKHVFSHRKWHIQIQAGQVTETKQFSDREIRWVSPQEFSDYPLAKPQQKIWQAYKNNSRR